MPTRAETRARIAHLQGFINSLNTNPDTLINTQSIVEEIARLTGLEDAVAPEAPDPPGMMSRTEYPVTPIEQEVTWTQTPVAVDIETPTFTRAEVERAMASSYDAVVREPRSSPSPQWAENYMLRELDRDRYRETWETNAAYRRGVASTAPVGYERPGTESIGNMIVSGFKIKLKWALENQDNTDAQTLVRMVATGHIRIVTLGAVVVDAETNREHPIEQVTCNMSWTRHMNLMSLEQRRMGAEQLVDGAIADMLRQIVRRAETSRRVVMSNTYKFNLGELREDPSQFTYNVPLYTAIAFIN